VEDNKLFPDNQSAYRRFHSTETAVVLVFNDLVRAIDNGKVSALVLLDMSAAFDTVDHDVLLTVLNRRFALDDTALSWFRSYLTNRTQTFSYSGTQSDTFPLECSVPQGTILGPVEFIAYTEDVTDIFPPHQVRYHMYADDIQLYYSVSVNDVEAARMVLQSCVSDVINWCAPRRLQLNGDKTELAWFGSHAKLTKLAQSDCSITIGNVTIKPSSVVRNLGVWLDSELTLKQHVAKLANSCYFQLRRIRQIRRCLGQDAAMQLVSAFVFSRLDYCNSILAGLPKSTVATLQHVQNAAARLVLDLQPRDHITHALYQLHWLPVSFRIQFKLCLLMHHIHTRRSPAYMADTVKLVSDNSSRPGLRSASTFQYIKPRLRTVMGERAFCYAGPNAWNSLPPFLHTIDCTDTFKRRLKTHYFNIAFLS
jgi:hypothetical protein